MSAVPKKPSLSMNDYLLCLCWCERSTVWVRESDVVDGATAPCTRGQACIRDYLDSSHAD